MNKKNAKTVRKNLNLKNQKIE